MGTDLPPSDHLQLASRSRRLLLAEQTLHSLCPPSPSRFSAYGGMFFPVQVNTVTVRGLRTNLLNISTAASGVRTPFQPPEKVQKSLSRARFTPSGLGQVCLYWDSAARPARFEHPACRFVAMQRRGINDLVRVLTITQACLSCLSLGGLTSWAKSLVKSKRASHGVSTNLGTAEGSSANSPKRIPKRRTAVPIRDLLRSCVKHLIVDQKFVRV